MTLTDADLARLEALDADLARLRAKLGRFEAMLPLDGSVYPLTTEDIRRVLADDTGKYVVVPVADLSIVPADAELRAARAALARVKALCDRAEALAVDLGAETASLSTTWIREAIEGASGE